MQQALRIAPEAELTVHPWLWLVPLGIVLAPLVLAFAIVHAARRPS